MKCQYYSQGWNMNVIIIIMMQVKVIMKEVKKAKMEIMKLNLLMMSQVIHSDGALKTDSIAPYE